MCYQKGSENADIRSAHNNDKALLNHDNGFEKGQDMDKRAKGESNLCEPEEGEKYQHAKTGNEISKIQYSGHTEARLLDGLGARESGGFPTSGTLTLKIDWRPKGKGGTSSPMPCTKCHELLCAAKA